MRWSKNIYGFQGETIAIPLESISISRRDKYINVKERTNVPIPLPIYKKYALWIGYIIYIRGVIVACISRYNLCHS